LATEESPQTATNLRGPRSRTGAIDRTSETGARHPQKYGFSFKPGQDAPNADLSPNENEN